MSIRDAIRCEIIKALACGKTNAEIKAAMNVTDEKIKDITPEEIEQERQYLREMGYI